jgi:prolipoprotein diacylglyceryltransferase
MWSYKYPHNVNEMGVPIPGCTDTQFCNQLEVGAYPTPFYETVICFILFLLLWSLRKRLKIPGTLFALYLMLNGLERFFIEKIRVNSTLNFFGLQITQAELISGLLFITGLILWIWLFRRAKNKKSTITANNPHG